MKQENNDIQSSTGRIAIIMAVIVGLLALLGGGSWFYLNSTQQAAAASFINARDAAAEADWTRVVRETDAMLAQPAFAQQHTAEAYGLRGIAKFYQNDGSARADFDQALAVDSSLTELYAYRALLLFQLDVDDAALADTGQALANSESLTPYLQTQLQAESALAMTGRPEGIEAAANALNQPGYLTDSQLSQMAAIVALADPAGRLEEVELALTADPNALEATQQAALKGELALAFAVRGDDAATLRTIDEALGLSGEIDPALGAALLETKARILLDNGNLDGAIEAANAASGYQADISLPLSLAAFQAYQAFDYDRAIAKADEALAINGEDPLAHQVKGSALAWQAELVPALESLDAALVLNPESVETLAMRAFAHYYMDDYAGMTADIETLIEMAPTAPASLWAQAIGAYSISNHPAIQPLMDAAIEQDGTRPEFFVWRSRGYEREADLKLLEADLDTALSLNPNDLFTLYDRTSLPREVYDYPTYVDELKAFVEQHPNFPSGYGKLAEGLVSIDELDKAQVNLDKGLELFPESLYLRRVEGILLSAREEYDAARAIFNELVENEHEELAALSDFIFLEIQADNIAAARNLYERAAAKRPDSIYF
ncbi:MAG: hypothetical protein AAF633_15180, partial [Chloroflexota bacterium]